MTLYLLLIIFQDMMPLPPTSPQIMSRPSRDSITPYGNLTLNQSIYANTVTLPKINGNGNATHMRHNGSPVTHMRQNASPVTHRRHGASPVRHGSNGSNGSGPMPKRGGKFMEGVPGVALFTRQPKLSTIQV